MEIVITEEPEVDDSQYDEEPPARLVKIYAY